MTNNKVYFKKLNNIGDLYIVSVLFEFDSVPIVFICKNKNNKYYICNLNNDYKKLEWLLCEVSYIDIYNLLCNMSDVLSVYLSNKYLYHIVKKEDNYIVNKHFVSKYKKSELPEKDIFLDLSFAEIDNIYNIIYASNNIKNDNNSTVVEFKLDDFSTKNVVTKKDYDYSIAA